MANDPIDDIMAMIERYANDQGLPGGGDEIRAAIIALARTTAAAAWDEGTQAGWATSCEGWNAEYPEGAHLDMSEQANPYRRDNTAAANKH